MSDDATLQVTANAPPAALHTPALPCIQVLSGSAAGLTLMVVPQVTFGRHTDCDALLEDQGVSRNHARVFLRGTEVWVEDLGSTNGTHLRGKPVKQEPLNEGDIIGMGPVLVKFTYLSRAELDLAEEQPKHARSSGEGEAGPLDKTRLIRWVASEIHANNGSFTLVLAEIDDWKNIRGACGASSSQLLNRQLCQLLRGICRPDDLVEPLGDHGFAILLRGMSLASASITMANLRKAIADRTFPVNQAIELQLTLTTGMASSGRGFTAEHLVEQATQELVENQAKGH